MDRFVRMAVILGVCIMSPGPGTPGSTDAEPTGSVLDPFLSEVSREVLPNGLTVLFRPDPGSGVVAINTWVKAGYFHEPDEVAGMAHLFEHMFFKGSKHFPGAEQIARELSRVGGQTNAGTIYDSTNYYFVLPSESFERGLEIQADAVMHPLFDAEELQKEAEVVIEESSRKLDNPPAVSLERMFETAFTEHRIRRWRIGSEEVLRNIQRQDLVAFFETLYRPENIVLSIAGDVTSERVARSLAETFAKLPRGELRTSRSPQEPPQEAFRFGSSSADITQGYSVLGWHTPGVGAADEVPLEVLADILGTGRSSRLYRSVIGPEGASTVYAYHWPIEDIGVLFVQASFDEANRAEVERRILHEVERMKRFGPTSYELQLAVNRAESATVLGLQTVLGQARALADAEATYGDYRRLGGRLARLKEVTPERVRDVARRYLTAANLTLYHYRPSGAEGATRDQALTMVRAAFSAENLEAEEPFPLPEPVAAVDPATQDKAPRESRLQNGLPLVVEERRGAPVVSVGVYFRGGRIGETSRNAGITQLMADVMRRGTAGRSAEQIDREIEFLGSQISSEAASDFFGFRLTILAKNFSRGLELLADVVLHPSFPADELSEAKALQLAAIKRSMDSSSQRPFQLLYGAHYGNHPYALPGNGYLSSVATLERRDLEDWWRRWVTSDDAVLVVVGDIAADEARALVEEKFGALEERGDALPPVPEVIPPQNPIRTVEFRERKQSAITVAFSAVPPGHPDWPELRLLRNVTSGLAGTFFADLRGNRSLAYTVYAREVSRRDHGVFVGYLASDASKEAEALEALVEKFRKLDDDGFTDDDVERAKAYLAGSTRIARQSNAAHVNELVEAWAFDLGLDFTDRLLEEVRKVTADELREVSARYFEGTHYTTAIVSGRPD